MRFNAASIGIRFGTDILADVETGGPAQIEFVTDIEFSANGVVVDYSEGGLQLAPAYLFGTEIVVEIEDLVPVFGSMNPIGLEMGEGFEGICFEKLSVTVPPDLLQRDEALTLSIENGAIGNTGFRGTLILSEELVLAPPGVDCLSLVLGGTEEASFQIEATVDSSGLFSFSIADIEVTVRVDANILRPVDPVTDEPDMSVENLDIQLGVMSFGFDANGNFDFDFFGGLTLPRCMIGESGVVISAEDVILRLSDAQELPQEATDIGLSSNWRGLYIGEASVSLPQSLGDSLPDDLTLSDCFIGQGGFSGSIDVDWDGDGLFVELFEMELALTHFGLEFVQNSLVGTDINGTINMPFFNGPLGVQIGFDLSGNLAIELSREDGLCALTKDGILTLELDSLGFEIENGVFKAIISGSVTPLFGAPELDWPTIDVKELSIDSNGNVAVEGGWLDLLNGFTLDFYGFQIEITKLGLGHEDDGGKWVGFSGGLKLVDGISAGASVDGLRITWYDDGSKDTKISLNGAGVELLIPETLRFKGEVSFREYTNDEGNQIRRFDGALSINILCVGLEIEGQIVFGMADDDPFMAIFLALELPAGIPLGSTGLALYGLAGLTAVQMLPNRKPEEPWYDISHNDWFHRDEPGVAVLSKWDYKKDAFAIGAGVTIGTQPDNGYTFAGKLLLVVTIPGPVIFLEGRANLLKERSKLSDEPVFHSVAILDMIAGEVLFGVDAKYSYDEEGSIIKIGGSTEGYFNWNDPETWHLYIGKKTPESQRIRADIFDFFEANGWFMLDNSGIDTGMWVGFDWGADFDVVSVTAIATIEGEACLSFRPVHFTGYLDLYGKLAISVCGVGFSLELDAGIEAEVDDPTKLLAHLSFSLDLPWPLDDINIDVDVTLINESEVCLSLPEPLQEVAVEHFKTSTSWPLERSKFLTKDSLSSPPDDAPVVPIDSRPHITFKRPVQDGALAGVNPSNQSGNDAWEWIGDPNKGKGPAQAKYTLTRVALSRWNEATNDWELVAEKEEPGTSGSGIDELYGSWDPVPSLPSGLAADGTDESTSNVKLWLYSKNPFNYTRRTSHEWEEWFSERYPNYPCPPTPEFSEDKYDFTMIEPKAEVKMVWEEQEDGSFASPGWAHPEEPDLIFWWRTYPEHNPVHVFGGVQEYEGLNMALWIPGGPEDTSLPRNYLTAAVPNPDNCGIKLKLRCPGECTIKVHWVDNGQHWRELTISGDQTIEIIQPGTVMFTMTSDAGFYLYEICVLHGVEEEVDQYMSVAEHIRESLAVWKNDSFVFEPMRHYQLEVRTRTESRLVDENGNVESTFAPVSHSDFAYFQTQGPPGFAGLSVPANIREDDEDKVLNDGWTEASGTGNEPQLKLVGVGGCESDRPVLNSELNDLKLYVEQTMPPTVPAEGEKKPLPRPVYRAYDIDVQFCDEDDYVARMYREYGRDLTLQLFDSNNRPVRDQEGRLVIVDNHWGDRRVDPDSLESASSWFRHVEESPCVHMSVSGDSIISSPTVKASGYVLDADTVYEARLVSLLFREDFSGIDDEGVSVSASARWDVVDSGSIGGPSCWTVGTEGGENERTYHVSQTSRISGGSGSSRPGTILLCKGSPFLSSDHPDIPEQWTCYRFNVQLRSPEDRPVGVVFAYKESTGYYMFTMGEGVQRLVTVVEDDEALLAESEFDLELNRDYRVSVELLDERVAVFVDGALIFCVEDSLLITHTTGSVGLCCSNNAGVRFTDISVDDLRETAKSLYQFAFTTSRYVDFYHQLHSFNDETWLLEHSGDIDMSTGETRAVSISQTDPAWPTLDESKALETLADNVSVLGEDLSRIVERVEVSKLNDSSGARAFLVSSPEPIDWHRTTISLDNANLPIGTGLAPEVLKISDIDWLEPPDAPRTVTLLAREPVSLAGHSLEIQSHSGLVQQPRTHCVSLTDELRDALEQYFDAHGSFDFERDIQILDQGILFTPSRWKALDGFIEQSSRIVGGTVDRDSLEKPGSMALLPGSWSNARIMITLAVLDSGDVGVVFRLRDDANYYRFSVNRRWGYQRLVKVSGGEYTLLWEEVNKTVFDVPYHLVIETVGSRMRAERCGEELFDIHDSTLSRGRIGLYSWHCGSCRFEGFRVTPVEHNRRYSFSRWKEGPEFFKYPAGILESENIWFPDDDSTPSSRPEATALAISGDVSWTEYSYRVSFESACLTNLRFFVRYSDARNHYSVVLDKNTGALRLMCMSDGVETLLDTSGPLPVTPEIWTLEIVVVMDRIVVHLNGVPLIDVNDGANVRGRVGVSCFPSDSQSIESAVVCQASLVQMSLYQDNFQNGDISEWRIYDRGGLSAPSKWIVENGCLHQLSNIYTAGSSRRSPDQPGTHAVTGNLSWTDYVLTVTLSSNDDDIVGLVFRYQDESNFYRFAMDKESRYRHLAKCVDGEFEVLWTDDYHDPFGYTMNRNYQLTIIANGTTLKGYMDDIPVFHVDDDALSSGMIGLHTSHCKNVSFSKVRVLPLGALGGGTIHHAVLEEASLEGWDIVDCDGGGQSSSWIIDNGRLLQVKNIFNEEARTSPDKLGTMALTGSVDWRDYRMSVRLATIGDNDAIGVVFRYRDERNYLRFSMDHDRMYRRLVQNKNGHIDVLWEDTNNGYQLDRDYIVTAECTGNIIRVYLDGVLLCEALVSHNLQGRVGVYCFANEGAVFKEVYVTAPTWFTYAEFFEHEPVLAAGTKVDIYREKIDIPLEPAPGIVTREALPQHFTLKDSLLRMRLVDDMGRVKHERAFIATGQFEPQQAKMLRNCDGTRLLVLPVTGDTFPSGSYRLKFRYRRKVDDLPVLSRASDLTDETVELIFE